MSIRILHRLQMLLSWFGLYAALFAVVVVLGNYIVSAQQVYRGPSLFYFYTFFLAAIWSRKWSSFLLILCLPLLPNMANQVAYIIHPRVPYFISYPGVDAVVGLFAGQLVNGIYKKQKLRAIFGLPPWPVGLTILVITISTGITIARNLWQSAARFDLLGFLSNLLRFKHMGLANNYLVLTDLIVYCGCVLLIICLLPTIKQSDKPNDVVFKPVVFGLVVSATWGMVQSMTGFGLPDFALHYRTDTIGYSAFGFQPDIHAFAGHMLIGTIGLFAYLLSDEREQTERWTRIILFACLISWVALILSKSRATFIFALLFTAFVLANVVFRQSDYKTKRRFIIVSLLGLILITLLSLTGNHWFNTAIDELMALEHINFQTLNRLSVYRLELFGIALKMFGTFPLMGVGPGNFLHVSSVPSYISPGGSENAHNYFLQTLAELGLAGAVGFTLVFTVPFFANKNRRALTAVSVAIIAIFLGNIYSHPLIIRDNLLFVGVFVALLYAQSSMTTIPVVSEQRPRSVNLTATIILFSVLGFCCFAYLEVVRSFSTTSFINGAECFKETDQTNDGWMSGRLTIDLPVDASSLRVLIDQNQPDAVSHPLGATLLVIDETEHILIKKTYLDLSENVFSMELTLPDASNKTRQGSIRANLLLSRCFAESNFALSDDTKRRGLHIKQILIER